MGLISQTEQLVVWGSKFAVITALTLGPFLAVAVSSLAGVEKVPTLYCTSLSVHQFNWPFLSHYATEAFCLTRSHLQSDIRMKDWQKSHFSSFSPNVCFSWQILCFLQLCFRACNSLLWINSGSTRPWPSQRSPPFSLLHQSQDLRLSLLFNPS